VTKESILIEQLQISLNHVVCRSATFALSNTGMETANYQGVEEGTYIEACMNSNEKFSVFLSGLSSLKVFRV